MSTARTAAATRPLTVSFQPAPSVQIFTRTLAHSDSRLPSRLPRLLCSLECSARARLAGHQGLAPQAQCLWSTYVEAPSPPAHDHPLTRLRPTERARTFHFLRHPFPTVLETWDGWSVGTAARRCLRKDAQTSVLMDGDREPASMGDMEPHDVDDALGNRRTSRAKSGLLTSIYFVQTTARRER